MSEKITIVSCPTCGKKVAWLPINRFRPFCSERCKNMDLGAWASERFRMPTQDAPDDAVFGDARRSDS